MKKRIIACIAMASIVISMCGCHSCEFSEATCVQPRTCTICGATEGEADGAHSVELGKCEICGEFQNYEAMMKLHDAIIKAAAFNDEADKMMANMDQNDYKYYFIAHSQYCDIITEFKKGVNALIEVRNIAFLADYKFITTFNKVAGFEFYYPLANANDNDELIKSLDSMIAYKTAFNELVLAVADLEAGNTN